MYGGPPASSRFDELVDHFAMDGITLAEPSTGKVLRVSPVGDPIQSSREDIRAECVNSQEVAFNFYLAPSDNVFCSIRTVRSNVVRESFSLDGKTEEQSLHVIENLATLFCRRTEQRSAFGFVADRHAELHRDFHWDDFFIGETSRPPEWPLVLGCADGFVKRTAVPSGSYSQTRLEPNCILFHKTEVAR